MATISLEVEKLLAAFVLALCDLGTCTASRAPIKFCIWPVIFAMEPLSQNVCIVSFISLETGILYFKSQETNLSVLPLFPRLPI